MKQIRTTEEIASIINQNGQAIIDNISYESIEVYSFLKAQFAASNVTENYLFQFVYRSFFRLDNAGLTPLFKTEYFKIMQEYRTKENFDFATILARLMGFVNFLERPTFQFSFTTKMQNMINNDKPIYDNEVAKVFLFNRPKPGLAFDEKLDIYLSQLQNIEQTYSTILANNSLKNVLTLFDKKFAHNNLGQIKKLDFIIWSAGKII